MAVQLEAIREAAQRVATSHHLELVDLEFQGGTKFRTLRVFIEKEAAERIRLSKQAESDPGAGLPTGVTAETLSWVTHTDCEEFARDFGTLLDVEDLVPGGEYTLEVSSPGLDRRLKTVEDFSRFQGSLVKIQTFTPIANNRHWQGRLTRIEGEVLTLDPTAIRQRGRGRKAAPEQSVDIALTNIEKAQLIAEL